jgi:hypothetical protein
MSFSFDDLMAQLENGDASARDALGRAWNDKIQEAAQARYDAQAAHEALLLAQQGQQAHPPVAPVLQFDPTALAQAFAAAQLANRVSPSTQDHLKLSELPKLPIFKGDNGSLLPFLASCLVRFQSNPERFATDTAKINFALSAFQGTAMKLVQPDLNLAPSQRPLWYSTWALFVAQLKINFGDADPRTTAKRKIKSLRQTSSALHYWVEFQLLKTDLDWKDAALQDAFYDGLSDQVKDALTLHPEPLSLSALKDLAIRLDNRGAQRNREKCKGSNGDNKDGKNGRPGNGGKNRDDNGRYSSQNHQSGRHGHNNHQGSSSSNQQRGPTDMDIDATSQLKLVNGKVPGNIMKWRIDNNKCLYDGCDKAGNCEALKIKEQKKAQASSRSNDRKVGSVQWSVGGAPTGADAKNDSA